MCPIINNYNILSTQQQNNTTPLYTAKIAQQARTTRHLNCTDLTDRLGSIRSDHANSESQMMRSEKVEGEKPAH